MGAGAVIGGSGPCPVATGPSGSWGEIGMEGRIGRGHASARAVGARALPLALALATVLLAGLASAAARNTAAASPSAWTVDQQYPPTAGSLSAVSCPTSSDCFAAGFNSVDWSADGKSLFVSSQSPTAATLLHVDMEGRATPLWNQRGSWRTFAIAAPNGRELAIMGQTSNSNVWMIENF